MTKRFTFLRKRFFMARCCAFATMTMLAAVLFAAETVYGSGDYS